MRSLFKRPKVLKGASQASAPAGPQHADVIVVDDSPGVRNIVSQLVGRAGLSSRSAASHDEIKSFELVRSSRLILLDLALERSDAIDVLRDLADGTYPGSVVIMSGQDDSVLSYVSALGTSLGLKMLPPLRKPFKVDELRQILSRTARQKSEAVEIDFDEVLAKRQLEVWYQPRIDLRFFKIAGFEALARIRHPQAGLLLPGRFMSRLSDADMSRLTVFVLGETVRSWEALSKGGFVLKASINIRARDLVSPDIFEAVRAGRPADPRWPGLIMELTEPKRLDEVEAAREALVRFRLHKVQFAIDDFTSVASGFVTCPELRLCEVAVDARFVRGCARDPDRMTICKAAAGFGRQQNLRTVAEGVETVEDLGAVKALGFDWAQGNLFSAAIPFRDLDALVRRNQPFFGGSPDAVTAAVRPGST